MRTKYFFAILMTLTLLFVGPFQSFGQRTIEGTVVFLENESLMEGVQITINQRFKSQTDQNGKFRFDNFEKEEEITDLTATKLGFELAGWTYQDDVVSVTMREATMKTIEGRLLSPDGNPLAKLEIALSNGMRTRTDNEGRFSFKLPYDGTTALEGEFSVAGREVRVNSREEDKTSALIEIELVGIPQSVDESIVFNFQFGDGTPVPDLLVKIGSKFFITNSAGEIRAIGITPEDKIEVEDFSINKINPTGSNAITVELINPSVTYQTDTISKALANIQRSLDTAIMNIDSTNNLTGDYPPSQVSEDIETIQDFYTEQESQFREQNERILSITENISRMNNISDEDLSRLVDQMERLADHLESTTDAFSETKENSLVLIMRLRAKLAEKDKTIAIIQEEKQELLTQFRNNIVLFLTILGSVSLLLLLAILTIKRFKTQNAIINETKKQLLEAQRIARIGSMIYNFKKQAFTFSENFFETLGIQKGRRIKRLTTQSNEVISGDLIVPEDVERVQNEWKEGISRKEPLNIEFKGNSDNGNPIYIDLLANYSLDTNGSITEISSTLQDVTQKKENELKLVKAMHDIEEASRIKEQFLSAMSHEIRTPLNAIIGLTNHLITERPRPDQVKNLNSIQFSSEHLMSLVNDVLDFSKIKAGKLKIEHDDLDIRDLLENLLDVTSLAAKEKGIDLRLKIDMDVPQFVMSDRVRINQILINLVGNSIKFTDSGGVTISLEKSTNGRDPFIYRFSVLDTGIGIAEENIGKIFESFEQESISTTRKYGGTGLGLSISKELVDLLGGELKVKSTPGEGSEFYFEIPLGQSDLEGKRGGSRTTPSTKMPGIKVLCVEDNEINQLVISQYFKKWEIDALFAETGGKALETFSNNPFDLVLMDIRLPDMDGYEISQKIIEDFPERRTPIVALTADMDQDTEIRIKQSGMVDYVTKPFNPDDLNNVILKYTTTTSQ